MADDHSSRRSFLRDFMRQAAKGVSEATDAFGGLPSLAPSELGEGTAELLMPPVAPRAPAQPTTRCLSRDELLALAAEEGLHGRDDALRRLARRSVRLTPLGPEEPEERAGAWIGGVPSLDSLVTWPSWAAGQLGLVVQVDLADPALAGFDDADGWSLPGSGRLLVFYDTERVPSGLQAAQEGAARVLVEPEGTLAANGGQPLRLTGELTLPRVWSVEVQELDLSGDEHDAYDRVRDELAVRQGVEPDDGGIATAYHRLLGHPDEATETMPRVCELTARGLDAEPPSQLDLVSDADAAHWRLLLQLTVEPPLDWQGEPGVRLYVWITAEQLAAGELDRVWAIPR